MLEEIKEDAEIRMGKSIESLKIDFAKIRTGRAHTSLLDTITIEYYGSRVPLSQVANVSVADFRTLSVTPWEKDLVKAIEKAIMSSDLGLNPSTTGTIIRIPLPPLTEERRKDLIKVVRAEAEGGRVAIRNIRRDALGDSKSLLKDKDISEDEDRKMQDDVKKITDKFVAKVEEILKEKEKELMEI